MKNSKSWVIAVNMGYGHQRTAFPLKHLSVNKEIINANDYKGIPEEDKKIWQSSRNFYEFISRFKRMPLIGEIAFQLFDRFQQIPSFYPKRDLSKPNFILKKIYSLIKKGWGKDLILRLSKNPYPLITTFFTPAFMAEVFDYPGEIFCVICDADIARAWAPLKPQESRIRYFVPNSWVRDRLKLYGVKEKNIILTGYPLSKDIIGEKEKLEILKSDLVYRILNLDPQGKCRQRYKDLIRRQIGFLPKKSDHCLTILFSVGGAGAQKEIVVRFVESLAERIKRGEIRIILSAGVRERVRDYFLKNLRQIGLDRKAEIVFDREINGYFRKFNQALRKTDILWTKPSELSFYASLGIPILIAPSIGAQEDFNRKWLLWTGAGIVQENPKYANQWLFDYLSSGRFAEAAIYGFIKIEKLGAYNIEKALGIIR